MHSMYMYTDDTITVHTNDADQSSRPASITPAPFRPTQYEQHFHRHFSFTQTAPPVASSVHRQTCAPSKRASCTELPPLSAPLSPLGQNTHPLPRTPLPPCGSHEADSGTCARAQRPDIPLRTHCAATPG